MITMVYPTLKATVQQGKIELIDDVPLPEDAFVLVTIMDESARNTLSLGDRIIAGLQDVLHGRVTEINTQQDLKKHFERISNEA
jgi:hypothetical protein